MTIADDGDEGLLALNFLDVHGGEAADRARSNARAAALGGRPIQARSWIRVLGIIQRLQAAKKRAPNPAEGSA